MRRADDNTSGPGPGPDLTHGNLAFTEGSHPDSGCISIPVQVVPRHTGHAKQYSRDEWEAMKPTIRRLYVDDFRSLRSLARTMAENYDFHATNRMYKIRFSLWGWRKNRTKDRQPTVVRPRPLTRRSAPTHDRIRHLNAPELLSDQEVPILIAKNYMIDLSESPSWNCIALRMSEPTPSTLQHDSMIRCCEAETAFSNAVHQLRNSQIHSAFQSLSRLFDSMTGSDLYVHPKNITGLWRLCDGVYNVCTWLDDPGFRLLRELLCFQGQNATASFKKSASPGAQLVVSMMRSVARMSRDNPGVMKQTFRNAYRAAAESLEKKLGRNHPIVLITWTDYFWYFGLPVDPRRNLTASQQMALGEAETASGPEADITICLLHNAVFFLFYCVGDYARAREKLSVLLERTSRRVAAQTFPTGHNFHIQRAHAFGSLLQGLFILQDHGDLDRCEAVVGAAIEWLRGCEGTDAFIHAKMLETDLLILTNAWERRENLGGLTLAFANPRSADWITTKNGSGECRRLEGQHNEASACSDDACK